MIEDRHSSAPGLFSEAERETAAEHLVAVVRREEALVSEFPYALRLPVSSGRYRLHRARGAGVNRRGALHQWRRTPCLPPRLQRTAKILPGNWSA